MFPRCHLHIGMEKTGTTTIQAAMANNRKVLENQGYTYSRSMGRDNHVNLVAYARDDDTSDNQRKRALARKGQTLDAFRHELEVLFNEEARKHSGKVLLLSNEHLQSRLTNIREKTRLKELLDQQCGDIEIYLYVRRQDLVAVSLYGTRLLSGAKLKYGKVFPDLNSQQPLPYFYDYLTIWREWCTVFGKDHVHLRIFAPGRLEDNDIVTDYLSWLGLQNLQGIVLPSRQNESISAAAQYLMSRMNELNPTFFETTPNPLRGRADHRVIESCKGQGLQPARAEAEAFYSLFRDRNATLFSEAGLDVENFIPDFEFFPEVVTAETVSRQELADASVKLFKNVVAELNETRKELALLKRNNRNEI